MTMVTTRSETERPSRSPETSADREPREPRETHEPTDAAVGSGHPDAPRAGLRGVRTWRPTPRLLWTVTAVLLLAAVAVTATATSSRTAVTVHSSRGVGRHVRTPQRPARGASG